VSMAFSVISKFIGNSKLLQTDVIPSRAADPTSWIDSFSFDTFTAAPILPLWTPTTVGAGAITHSTTAWSAILTADTNANDFASIMSIVQPTTKYSDDCYCAVRFQLFTGGASIPAPADATCCIGLSDAAGTRKVELENTAADTFRLVCTDAGGTTNGTAFALELTLSPTIEIRLYVVGGVSTSAEVYVNDVLMSTVAANIPGPDEVYAYFGIEKINVAAAGNISIDVQYVQLFRVLTG